MASTEIILRDIFSQIPQIQGFTVRFGWGSEYMLNLHLLSVSSSQNKYPLIWLVESPEDVNIDTNRIERNIKLIIAKESEHKTNTNPIIWETEFETVLEPVFENVITALKCSGITQIVDNKYKKEKRTNYTENNKESKAIDQWNVIVFEGKVEFRTDYSCIKQIIF